MIHTLQRAKNSPNTQFGRFIKPNETNQVSLLIANAFGLEDAQKLDPAKVVVLEAPAKKWKIFSFMLKLQRDIRQISERTRQYFQENPSAKESIAFYWYQCKNQEAADQVRRHTPASAGRTQMETKQTAAFDVIVKATTSR